jgi:hypothetical protein
MSTVPEPANESLRPRDLALMLLASGELSPRQRARDQQADVAGSDLKRRVLTELVARDPDGPDLETALLAIVEAFGPPTGPTRSVALSFLEEWRMAVATPEWVAHLLGEAVAGRTEGRRRGRQLPG